MAGRFYIPSGSSAGPLGGGGLNGDEFASPSRLSPTSRSGPGRFYVSSTAGASPDVAAAKPRSLFEGIEAGAPDTPADLGAYADEQIRGGSDIYGVRPGLENVGGAVSAPFRGWGQGLTMAQEYLADVPEERSRLLLGPDTGAVDDFLGKSVSSPTPSSLAMEGIKLIHQAPFGYADISKPGAVAGEEDIYRRAFEKTNPTEARVEAVAEPALELGLQFATDPAMAGLGKLGTLGRGGRVAERLIGASFVPGMTEGAIHGAGEAVESYQREGLSPTTLRAGTRAVGEGLMAGFGAYHGIEGGKAAAKAEYEGKLGEYHDEATTMNARLDIENAQRAALAKGREMAERKAALEAQQQAQQQFAEATQQAYDNEQILQERSRQRDPNQALAEFGAAGQAAYDQNAAREFQTPDVEAEANRQTAENLRRERQAFPSAIEAAAGREPGAPRLTGTPAEKPLIPAEDYDVRYSEASRRAANEDAWIPPEAIEEAKAAERARAEAEARARAVHEATAAQAQQAHDDFAQALQGEGEVIDGPAQGPEGPMQGPVRPPPPPRLGPPRPAEALNIEEAAADAKAKGEVPDFAQILGEEPGAPTAPEADVPAGERREGDRRGRIRRKAIDSTVRFVGHQVAALAEKAGAALEAGDHETLAAHRAEAEAAIAKIKKNYPEADTAELEAKLDSFPRPEEPAKPATKDAEVQAEMTANRDARIKSRRRALKKRYPKSTPAQLKEHAEVEDRADHDALTDLPNAHVWEREEKSGKWGGRASADLGGLKLINDAEHLGHDAGDVYLRSVAVVLARVAKRMGGVITRKGGDEFVIFGTDVDHAHKVVAEMKRELLAHTIEYVAPDGTVTEFSGPSSEGRAGGPRLDYGYGKDFKEADQHLYSFRDRAEKRGQRIRRDKDRPGGRPDRPGVPGVVAEPPAGREIPVGKEIEALTPEQRKNRYEDWSTIEGVIESLDHRHNEPSHKIHVPGKGPEPEKVYTRAALDAKIRNGMQDFSESGPEIAAALRAEQYGRPTPDQHKLALRALEALHGAREIERADFELRQDREARKQETTDDEVPFDVPEEATTEARAEDEKGGRREYATRKKEAPTETYINGDRGVYTGEMREMHGGMFHAVEMQEGTAKGETKWTQKTPETVRELDALRDKRLAEDYPDEVRGAGTEFEGPGAEETNQSLRDLTAAQLNVMRGKMTPERAARFDQELARSKVTTGEPVKATLGEGVPAGGVVEQTPAGTQKVVPGSLNFNPNVKRRTEGRETRGPLFTQEEDARIRKEGASQKSLFDEEPAKPAEAAAEPTIPKPGGQGSLLYASRLRTPEARRGAVQEIVRGISAKIQELRPTAAKVKGLEDLAEDAYGKAEGKPGEVEAAVDLNRAIKEANDKADARRLTGPARERAIAQDVAQRMVEATLHEAAHGPEGGHGPRFHARLADLRQALGRGFEDAVAGVRTQLLEQAAERARTSLTVDAVRGEFPTARKVTKTADGFQVELPHGRAIRINTEGEVFYDAEAFQKGHGKPLSPDEEIAGSWQKIDRGGVIALAKGEGQHTLRHEVFHGAMALALNAKEKLAVVAKYGSEEKAAQAYAEWKPEQPHSLFAKIHQFFNRIYRRFKGPDATSAFEAVHEGKAFERAGEGEAGETQYATKPPGGGLPPQARTPPPPVSPVPAETRGDKFIRLMQDRFIRAQRVIDAVVAKGGTVNEWTDFKKAEELFHGAVNEKVSDAEKRYIPTLAKAMAKAGVELPVLDKFLIARHAAFRNAEIARRHEGRVTAGSGMSNKEAAQVLADYNKRGLTAKLKPALDLIDKMRDEQRKVLLDSGLVSKAQLKGWDESMGPHYVPLRTAEVDGGFGTGQGFDIRGKEAKFAAGRSTEADSPSMFMYAQLTRAIVRAEKNVVGQRFADFTKSNPDTSLWEHNVEHKKWAPNSKGIAREVLDPGAEANDFDYKVDGEKQRITVKDPLLLRALKNMSATETSQFLQLAGRGTRLFSALVTSYSPEFPLTNFARDIQTALGNVTAEQGGKVARTMVKNIPKAIGGVFRSLRDPSARDAWATRAKEFREDGGAVGFYQLKHVPALEREMGRKIRGAGPGVMPAVGRALTHVKDLVEDMNKAVENGTRLAIYSAVRDGGGSRQKAAHTALNATINFSKKGEVGPSINALYAFFNANVQGAARMAQVLKTPKGKKIAAGIIALGAAQDLYNRSVAGDDNEDGTNDYDDIPEYVKGRNMVLMTGKGKKPLLFPLPYGFNVLHTAGRQLVAGASGAVTPVRASANVLSGLVNAFNPLGGESDAVQMLSPTALDPIVQHVMNRDFTGKPIKPEKFPGSPEKPGSEQYFKNVSPVARELAKGLNTATGGDKVTPGLISVSPETMGHYWNFLTGGMGRFLSNTAASAASVAEGEAPALRNIPFVRRFAYDAPESQSGQKFRANADELDTLWGQYKTYAEEKNADQIKGLPIPMLRAKRDFDSIENRIREIRKYVKAHPDEEKRADTAVKQLQNRANAIVAKARQQAGRPPSPDAQ